MSGIDPAKEDVYLLSEAAILIGRSRQTLVNYINVGCAVRDEAGEEIDRVYLEFINTPSGRMTSREAYLRMLQKMNGQIPNGG